MFSVGPQTENLTNIERDLLFTWQIGGDDFEGLTAESLQQAGICGGATQGGVHSGALGVLNDNHLATRVLHACHKAGIINPTTGHPDTSKIDKTLANKIVLISRPKLKKLVEMLFFWEEEIVRWRLLTQEEDELAERLALGSILDVSEKTYCEETLRVIRAKKQVRPSMRDESGAGHIDDAALPAYVA